MSKNFSRDFRLTAAHQFEQVFKRGKRRKDRYFVVIAGCSGAGRPRLGMAISKRRAARAVDRNRIKRLVRESFRQSHADLANLDIVVLANGPTAQADNQTLNASLAAHWQALEKSPRGKQNHG